MQLWLDCLVEIFKVKLLMKPLQMSSWIFCSLTVNTLTMNKKPWQTCIATRLDEDAKELVMNEVSSYTHGMSLDGSIVEAFKAGVIIIDNPEEDFIVLLDHEITAEEANTIVELFNMEQG